MKKLVFAFILLFCCFSLSVFGLHKIEKSCSALISTLEEASAALENGEAETASRSLERVRVQWEKEKLSFNVFLDHTTLDTLDASLPAISKTLEEGEKKQVFDEIQKTIAVLSDIVEEQKISLGNIL